MTTATYASSSAGSPPKPMPGAASAPQQLRHAHAIERAPGEGVALNVNQRQLGHANLGTTSI
jgi:site-specific recombinase XerD